MCIARRQFRIQAGGADGDGDVRIGWLALVQGECPSNIAKAPQDSHLHRYCQLTGFCAEGFPYDGAPCPSQVTSSLQKRRSKLRHAHSVDNTPIPALLWA